MTERGKRGKRIQLYVREEDLFIIDRYAKKVGVSRSHLLIQSALAVVADKSLEGFTVATKKFVRGAIERALKNHVGRLHPPEP